MRASADPLQDDNKSRCLVNGSLFCPVDWSKGVRSANLPLGARPPIKVLPGSQGGEVEVSLESAAKAAFSSKQSLYHRGSSWGDSFWIPTGGSMLHLGIRRSTRQRRPLPSWRGAG